MQCFTLSNGVKIPAVGSGTNSFAKTDGVFNGMDPGIIIALESLAIQSSWITVAIRRRTPRVR